MSRFITSHATNEAEELAGLERRFPFAGFLIGGAVFGEIATTVLMLLAQA